MASSEVAKDMIWERLSDASQGYSEDLEDDEAYTIDDVDQPQSVAPADSPGLQDAEVDPHEHGGKNVQKQDLTIWKEHTQSQLSLAETLRRDASTVLCTPLQPPPMSARSSATNLSSNLALEELKRNIAKSEKLQRVLHSRVESTRQAIEKVSQYIALLLAAHTAKTVPMEVCEKRIELRSCRPPTELIQDHLQEALESERSVLTKARTQLANHIEAGQEVLKSLEGVKAQMVAEMQHKNQLLRLDRSSLNFAGFHSDESKLPRKDRALRSAMRERDATAIRELVRAMKELQELALRFCSESDALLLRTRRDAEQSAVQTRASLKKRINETMEFKKKLEKELVETGGTISSMEQSLAIMQKQLSGKAKWGKKESKAFASASSENLGSTNGKATLFDELCNVEVLTGLLLEKAMGAAGDFTSVVGLRQAEAILQLQSYALDEAIQNLEDALGSASGEALRKLNQVGPKLHLHQETLGIQLEQYRTGKEQVAEAMKERCAKVAATMENIKSARDQMTADLHCKTEALRIDVACSTVAKDVASSMQETASTRAHHAPETARGVFQLPTPRPYRPPLDPKALETLKKRVRASAYTGGGDAGSELDVIFRRFDKDGSGQLDDREVRMALRRTLRVPPSMISDAQISSLCALLDNDKSGSVSIDELVEFIGAGPVVSQRTGRPLKGPGVVLSPINTVEMSDTSSPIAEKKTPSHHNPPPRPHRPPLKKDEIDVLRMRLKAAAYSGSGMGRQLNEIFLRFDKDYSGQLEDHEVRQALRRVMRIPPSAISDVQISSLCALLDTDCSGAVSINELVDFVGPEPEVSHRTGKRLQNLLAKPATDDGEASPGKLPGIMTTSDVNMHSDRQAGSSELV